MDEDDPFLIVKPDDEKKKMSAYLKSQSGHGGSKCLETSSQGTSSTRSTTTSTAHETVSSSKTPERHVKKTNSGFHNSSASSGSGSVAIDFSSDFGNGLEFGQQGFGNPVFGDNSGFPDIGAAGSTTGFTIPGFANFGGNDTNSNGNGNGSGNASDGFAAFENDPFSETNPTVISDSTSTNAFGNDIFGIGGDTDPFATVDNTFGGSNHGGMQAFGSTSDDGFGLNSDPFATNEHKKTATDHTDTRKKRDPSKRPARAKSTNSTNVPGVRSSSRGPRDRRRCAVRRNHPTDANLDKSDRSKDSNLDKSDRSKSDKSDHSPGIPSRGSREKSPVGPSGRGKSPARVKERERERDRQPPGRTRSNRRERRPPVNHPADHPLSESSHVDGRSRRRGAVTHTRSDGSMEPAHRTHAVPERNKSVQLLSGSAHVSHPRSSRRRPSGGHVTGFGGDTSFDHTHSDSNSNSNLSASRHQEHPPATATSDKWEKERSRNQELIMSMYRDGGFSSKNQDTKNGSLGEIQVDLEAMKLQEENEGSADLGTPSFGQFLMNAVANRGVFATSLEDEDEERPPQAQPPKRPPRISARRQKSTNDATDYTDRRDVEGRNRATLLERVAVDTSGPTQVPSNSTKTDSKGLSYSDRILMAQRR